jgi:hypothetical protein
MSADALVFEDAIVPDAVITDLAPPTAGPEFACRVCGKELTYGGRGRKPTLCDEHKRGNSARSSVQKGGNEKLAAQAVESLMQLNGLVGMGLMFGGFLGTASAFSERQDGFREQAYQALLTDPALCKTILRGGKLSGRFSLALAYATLIGGTAPFALQEMRERKAAENADRT